MIRLHKWKQMLQVPFFEGGFKGILIRLSFILQHCLTVRVNKITFGND